MKIQKSQDYSVVSNTSWVTVPEKIRIMFDRSITERKGKELASMDMKRVEFHMYQYQDVGKRSLMYYTCFICFSALLKFS